MLGLWSEQGVYRPEREAAMGLSVGENGRPSGAHTGSRPVCDAAYAKLARELLRKLQLDHDEAFADAVARRFKEGPAKVCCRSIGKWIDRQLLEAGWTQQVLAERLGVDRSAVAKWT